MVCSTCSSTAWTSSGESSLPYPRRATRRLSDPRKVHFADAVAVVGHDGRERLAVFPVLIADCEIHMRFLMDTHTTPSLRSVPSWCPGFSRPPINTMPAEAGTPAFFSFIFCSQTARSSPRVVAESGSSNVSASDADPWLRGLSTSYFPAVQRRRPVPARLHLPLSVSRTGFATGSRA
jgi:hypothetical protein